MIKYLNHELIEFKPPYLTDEYIFFKCSKCDKFIFRTIDKETNELDWYWMYKDGVFKIPNIGDDIEWDFLGLTCEESVIKRLLE